LLETLDLHLQHFTQVDQLRFLTMDDLAYSLGVLGKVDSASLYYEELISMINKYSSKSDFYFHVIDNFSALLINEHQFDKAAVFYEELKTHFEGSPEYPLFLKDYYNVFINTPDYAKGWETGNLLVRTCEDQDLDCQDIITPDLLLNVARSGAILAQYNEALDLYKRAEQTFDQQPEMLVKVLLESAQLSPQIGRNAVQIQKLETALSLQKENSLTSALIIGLFFS